MYDLYNNLRIYEPEVKGTLSSSTNIQNVAFVFINNNTNGVVNIAHGATTASTKATAVNSTTIDNLSDVVICAFFANSYANNEGKEILEEHWKEVFREWAPRNQENRNRENTKRVVPVETTTFNALVSCDGSGNDWSDQTEEGPTNFALMAYSSTSSNSEVSTNSNYSSSCLENVKILKEKNEQLLKNLRTSKLNAIAYKTGLESVEARLIVYKKNDSIYEEDIKVSDNEEDDVPQAKIEKKTFKPSFAKIEFVKPKQQEKTARKSINHVEQNRQNIHTPRGNQRNWNNMMSQRLGSNFEMFNKACYVCGSFDHLQVDCKKVNQKQFQNTKPIWNNAQRVNHQNFAKKTHPCAKKNIVSRAVLMKSGLVSVNTARQVNATHTKTTVNAARPMSYLSKTTHLTVKRPIHKNTTFKNNNFNQRVNTVKDKNVNTARPKAIVNAVKGNNVNGVKASACWVWKSKNKVLDLIQVIDGLGPQKKLIFLSNVHGNPQIDLQDQRVIDSGCSRHMTGNMSYLTDYEEIDGGYVAFRGNPKGGKITGRARTPQQNGVAERKNKTLTEAARTMLADSKLPTTFWAEVVNTACYVQNRVLVIKPHNKTSYELFIGRKPALGFMRLFGCPVTNLNTIDYLGNFDGKARMESVPGKDYILLPFWTIDLPFSQISNSSLDAGFKPSSDDGKKVDEDSRNSERDDQEKDASVNSTNNVNASSTNEVNFVGRKVSIKLPDEPNMPALEDIVYSDDDEDDGVEADMKNLDAFMLVSPIPTTRFSKEQTIKTFKIACLPASYHKYTQEEGIDYDEVFAPIARIEAYRLFLAYASFKDFVVYQMDVKSAFLYGKIEEEVYVRQQQGFEDPDFPDRVYKVEKALYGLLQAPRAWSETLSTYLLDNGFQRGKIDKTLFIRRDKGDILLVQVYVDDIIFGSTKKSLCTEFEKMMHKKFQMSSMGELTFFLGLQVKQKEDGVFICQDKYVTKILKKFRFTDVKTASTPMETQKLFLKDEDGEEVDVHLYRSMISSLIYLTSSRPDIMFAVCAYARYQVNPKVSHLHAVKRIFRYLKGQPKLGLWYPKYSPFDLVAYTDSDYAGASLDRKSTTGGCQFLGSRLISWQCKKQTVVANSTTKAEYVAALSCCGQFWATVKAKTVNREVQLQALVDGKKIIITESIVRRDLQLEDAKGIDCLPNATIFEQLTLIGSKTTTWNEFSSTIASAIICLATNQKFNFSKYIFESMVKNLENVSGKGFSGRETPLFQTMVVQHQEEMGKGLANPTDPHHIPTIIQPSTSQSQKKEKSRMPKRKDTEILQPSGPTDNVADEAVNKEIDDSLERAATTATSLDAEQDRGAKKPWRDTIAQTRSKNVSKHSNDPLLAKGNTLRSGEDRLKLEKLMEFCTKLQQRVLDLENTKTAQAQEITSLKLRVTKLEKKRGSRTHKLKRLYKVGRSARMVSSDDASLGDQEDASKQGRKIDDIDKDVEITLIDETQGRYSDDLMFDTNVLDDEEVFAE
ncbi:putative ribonuclease H-like domain-containing protein [Tanacetum coccineum]